MAIAAAGLGTWDWDVPSGEVLWTPQMYCFFGVEPERFHATFDNVMDRILPSDRPHVEAHIDRTFRLTTPSVVEFRIRRPDGSVRWLRCRGRAFADDRGNPIRMAGVAEDVTDEAGHALHRVPEQEGSLSTRQVAQLLGIGEASVKRLANAGAIGFLRSSRKDSRRFAPDQVLDYLCRSGADGRQFDDAAAAGDVSSCVAALLQELRRGSALDELLDARVAPVARTAPPAFLHELLSRLPALSAEPRKSAPAFVAAIGHIETHAMELLDCALRGHGYSVLVPAENTQPQQLIDVAERIRPGVVALLVGTGSDDRRIATQVAAGITSRLRGVTVVAAYAGTHLSLPRGVFHMRSARDLSAALSG
ncbi:MAG TPA: PAS domain-containing protein [Myxococcales bacterium]|nr:PAS domain-containing protein [Myxococcales bacterium]